MTDSKPRKTKVVVFSILALIIVAGLAVGATLALTKHGTTNTKTQKTTMTNANTVPDTSQYKLATCTAGTSQTIGNASYLIGTDFPAGSYKVTSNAGDIGWSNVNVYSSKADYDKQGDPSNEQGVAAQSLSPQNGTTTVTKLTAGQYMVLDADTATFECEG